MNMPQPKEFDQQQLKHILEAALLAAGEPLNLAQLIALFDESSAPSQAQVTEALEALGADCADRGIELRKVASGHRLQVKQAYQEWVGRLWTERPQRYSRAMLETLALVAYRQPITRGEIEDVRGVSLSSNIIRTLQERDWIRVVGHRDVPGKPALFGTTRSFLDYFNLENLDELPTLAEIKDMENLEPELDLEPSVAMVGDPDDEAAADEVADEPDETAADAAEQGPEPERDALAE
jgi:segregation and condensation protein B